MTGDRHHERFLGQVVAAAAANVRAGDRPFATAIVRDGRVVATGVNAVVSLGDPTAHAEVVAIRAACARLGRPDLSDCALYTISEPCPMCMGAILWAGVGAVYFAATKDVSAACGFADFYSQLALPFAERSLPMRHIRLDAAEEVLRGGRLA